MPERVTIPARQYRAGAILARAAPEDPASDDRRVTLSFSSEEPVERDFGFEVLGHGDGEVDLSRLAAGRAPLLLDHRASLDGQVGVIEAAQIEGGRGVAVVRFGRSALADEILARVRDGEICNVSVGYAVTSLARIGTRGASGVYRAKWAPHEISLVSVPADASVGVGRAEAAPAGATISFEIPPLNGVSNMTPEQIAAAEQEAARLAAEEETREGDDPAKVPAKPADPVVAERARAREIRSIGRAFNVSADMIDAAETRGMSADAFRKQVMDHVTGPDATATRSRNAMVGLTDKEKRQFSLVRAIHALANPGDLKAQRAAAFEIEVSEAAQTKLRRSAQGILVPADILDAGNFVRAQSVGAPADGGNLVATDLMAGSFIEQLRKKSALSRLGVRTLSGLTGNVDLPRQVSGSSAYWVGEGETPTASGLKFDRVSLTPHTLAAQVPISRKALIQTSPGIEGLVREDLIAVMALAMDAAGLSGDGVDEPLGLIETAGVGEVTFAGEYPTADELIDMETAIFAADADAAAMRYLFNAKMRGHLKKTPVEAGHPEKILGADGLVNGYGHEVSNNAPAGAIFGNWAEFLIGMWSGLDLTVDQAALAGSGGIVLRAFQDVDFAIRHGASFTVGTPTGGSV